MQDRHGRLDRRRVLVVIGVILVILGIGGGTVPISMEPIQQPDGVIPLVLLIVGIGLILLGFSAMRRTLSH